MNPIQSPPRPFALMASSQAPVSKFLQITSPEQSLLASIPADLKIAGANYHIGKVNTLLAFPEAALLHAALHTDTSKQPVAPAMDEYGIHSYLIDASNAFASSHLPLGANLPEQLMVTCELNQSLALQRILISGKGDNHTYCLAQFEHPAPQTYPPQVEQPAGAGAAPAVRSTAPQAHDPRRTNLSLHPVNPYIPQGTKRGNSEAFSNEQGGASGAQRQRINKIAWQHLMGATVHAQTSVKRSDDNLRRSLLPQAQTQFNNVHTQPSSTSDRHALSMPLAQPEIMARPPASGMIAPPATSAATQTLGTALKAPQQSEARLRGPKMSKDTRDQIVSLHELGYTNPQISIQMPELKSRQISRVTSNLDPTKDNAGAS
jgi:hypothetical protein